MRSKVLIIHPGVGPYRVQFFEELSRRISVHFLFYSKSTIAHQTDAGKLRLASGSSLEYCIEERKKTWRPAKMMFRIFPRIFSAFFIHRPQTIVVSEYSPMSAFAALLGRICRVRVVLWSDDSLDCARDVLRIRKIQRSILFYLAHRLIVINPDVFRYYQSRFKGEVYTSLLLQPEELIRDHLFSDKTTSQAKALLMRHSLTGAKVILFVGRLSPEKNLYFLLGVFSELSSKKDLRLVFVGSGIEEDALRERTAQLDLEKKVVFTGYLPRDETLWAWFRMAGLFVLPSLYERFGAVVNESLICGVPVLCSKHAGASCLIEDGENGAVFGPKDVEGLAQCLSCWLDKIPSAESYTSVCCSLMKTSYKNSVSQFVAACAD